MSKRAQQNQSAFNVGHKIGLAIAKAEGTRTLIKPTFNRLFRAAYKGNRAFLVVAHKAALIGYAVGRAKAAEAAQPEPLTGEQHAKL